MLELNAMSAEADANDLVREVSEATFMADVIEASQDVPVIVDFWAPWCGPCKTLGPMLEQAVAEAGGKVRMAKVNVDENQGIAGQLRIQSIPTVYAFWQGQPVDGFQGAVPASEIKAFIDRLTGLAGDGGLGEAIQAAEEMLAEGAASDAAQTFAAILSEEPEHPAAYGGLVRAHIVAEQLDRAEALLEKAPEAVLGTSDLDAARAQLDLARQAEQAGPIPELRAVIENAPDNHQARFELAQALHAKGDVEEAVDELLELFKRAQDWNDGAAKAQLFTIFDALKPQDPIVLNGRRKLSSLIFA